MKLRVEIFVCAILLLLAAGAPAAWAQGATTGVLSGQVTAQADGAALPGAIVTAVHQPTGTRYNTVTRADGRFTIQNVRVGGPYLVTVTMDGFRTAQITGVNVNLSETVTVDVGLELAAIEASVEVVADVDPLITPHRTGITTNVSEQLILDLPTIERSLQDMVRVSPYFATAGGGAGDEETIVAVAGRNNRYNNIQIDGAVNNDLFGLAGSGTPGGQAATQPISLDAIKEIALVISPYDVRQGGFTGGGINAITRNGTNAYEGSVYYFTRDQDLVGDGPSDRPISNFKEEELGGRFGGPISRDRAFFFVSGETFERTAPSGFSADGSSGQSFVNPAAAVEFRQILQDVYGYDPGGLGEFTEARNSDKLFGRLDFNLSDSHQLTVRHNFVDADNDVYRPSTRSYDFPDRNYDFVNETNSTVVQLNSVFNDLFNEARVTYQTIEDRRSGANRFPTITVELPDGSELEAGTEPFSTANALDQTILEVTDDLTFLRGNHTITIGTHNELFEFDNLFIRQAFGDYEFLGLDALRAGKARSYDYSFSNTSDPLQSAQFEVYQLGLYAGDEWRVNDNLSLVYGVRYDVPLFPDDPARNPAAEASFGFRTDITADGNEMFSPRIGFNYNIPGGLDDQIRGGVGIFSGRSPFVWLSNQYSNTGVEFTRVSSFIPDSAFDPDTNFIPFSPDPDNQPRSIGNAATNEINLIDPSFEFPQVLRTSLGYDVNLPLGLNATVEGIWAETQEDVKFQNLNVVPTGETLPFDNRPTFTTLDRDFRDVILLTNTNRGEQWSLATTLTRRLQADGFFASVSWLYGESEVVTDGTSSQARSNWRFLEVKGDPNNPSLATSDFDPGHQINATASYTFDLGSLDNTVSLFYTARSGQVYSTTFSNDVNGDFQSNDLLYVPGSAGEVEIQGGTWEDFDAYIRADEGLNSARGSIVDRNASRAPWVHNLDLRYALELPIQRFSTEVTVDIINVANLIDSNDGVVRYVPFGEVSPVNYRGLNDEGKPIYRLNFTDPDERFNTDNLRSRWQAKLGLRFNF